MPPPPIPAGPSHHSTSSNPITYGYGRLSRTFFLVLLVAIGARIAIVSFLSSKRRRVRLHQPQQLQEKELYSRQAPSEEDLRRPQHPQSKDQRSAVKPIYPWLSPPLPLAGPYDHRLYPLPTLRRHSYDPSAFAPGQTSQISYSRRVSTNSIPTQQAILHGTITNSKKGWRRNQWVIAGE